MTPRFFRRVVLVSWTTVATGVAGIFMYVFFSPEAIPTSRTYDVALVTAIFAVPVALWSPVGLSCALALTSGGRPVARAGTVLSWAAAAMTLVVIIDAGDYRPGWPFWPLIVRMSLPVMMLTLACAHVSLLSMARVGRRWQWLVTSSAAAMFATAILVTIMVIVDTGNRALLGLLGVLLAVAVASALSVIVAHCGASRVASRAGVS